MSLLDVTLERLEGAGRELQPLARVSLIGRVAAGTSADAFAASCGERCKVSGTALTGLLMLLPNGWIQTVEGSLQDILPYLHFLAAQFADGKLAKLSVISQQEDIRSRYFPSWQSKSVSAMRSNYMEYDGEEGLAALVSEAVIGMLKIGKKLSEGQPVSIIDKWESNFADSMPSNERVDQLLDIPELPSLDAFLGIFDTPVDIIMESERVWPPERQQPY